MLLITVWSQHGVSLGGLGHDLHTRQTAKVAKNCSWQKIFMLPSNCTKSVVQLAVECRGRISRARPSCEASVRTTGARRRSYQARAGGARAHGCSARCTARDGPRSPRCGAGWRLELGRGVAGSPWWPRCARAYRCAPVEAAVCAGTRSRRATTTPTAASAARRGITFHMVLHTSGSRTLGQPMVECSPLVGVESCRGRSPRDAA